MPTYDYVCRACGHELELFQSMSEAPKRKCPECGKLKLERQIGKGAGVLFKGSGFYQTDYRSDSYNKGAKAEKEPDAKSAESKSAESKSAESKSAESKSAESKSAESKSAESKESGAKASSSKDTTPAKKASRDSEG
jgi:putative FmdB family regulatory protein